MKIAIFGASGNIGAGLVSFLTTETGHNIVPIFRSKRNIDLDTARLCDLRNPHQIAPALKGIDLAINLCGRISGNHYEDFLIDNLVCTTNLFNGCKEAGVSRLFHFSSLIASTHPDSHYGKTKLLSDEYLLEQDPSTVAVTIFKPSWVMTTTDESFLKRFISIVNWSPIIFIPRTGLFQPISEFSVYEAIADEIEKTTGTISHTVIPAVGTSMVTLKEFTECLCKLLEKRRLILELPIRMIVLLLKIFKFFSFGHYQYDLQELIRQGDDRIYTGTKLTTGHAVGSLEQELQKIRANLT